MVAALSCPVTSIICLIPGRKDQCWCSKNETELVSTSLTTAGSVGVRASFQTHPELMALLYTIYQNGRAAICQSLIWSGCNR